MTSRSVLHPPWCDYPHAPGDETHTHTAAVGSVFLAGDVTAEVVLVQAPGPAAPMVTLHITGPRERVSVDMTGMQSWTLAGVVIDATVRHHHATLDAAPTLAGSASRTRSRASRVAPWRLARRSAARRVLRVARCRPGAGGADV
jgi:hypothetical protein